MRFVYNISIMHIHHHPTCKFIVLIVEIDFEESETHTSHCVGFLRVSLANLPIGIAGGKFFLTRRNTNGIVLTPLRSSLRFYSCHLRHLWPWPQRFFFWARPAEIATENSNCAHLQFNTWRITRTWLPTRITLTWLPTHALSSEQKQKMDPWWLSRPTPEFGH